tara:strand:+ start:635 stop:919 length:285 start_codon:yes stop_codon:yes gene_type:complete
VWSFYALNSKQSFKAYEIHEDITSIIACQEKSYAFPMPFSVTFWIDLININFLKTFVNQAFIIKAYINSRKTMILHEKNNFARYGMKTPIILAM